MSKRTDQDYLDDIREATARIRQYTEGYDGVSYPAIWLSASSGPI